MYILLPNIAYSCVNNDIEPCTMMLEKQQYVPIKRRKGTTAQYHDSINKDTEYTVNNDDTLYQLPHAKMNVSCYDDDDDPGTTHNNTMHQSSQW
jgi:hypothetical protein